MSIRKSNFPAQTSVLAGATMDYWVSGVNYKITVDNLITAFGTTGSIVEAGDAANASVLEDSGLIKGIRTIEGGVGINTTIAANNSLKVDWDIDQDGTGIQIFDNLTVAQPTAASITAGTGISVTKAADLIIIPAPRS
jgi:hypothetical protein